MRCRTMRRYSSQVAHGARIHRATGIGSVFSACRTSARCRQRVSSRNTIHRQGMMACIARPSQSWAGLPWMLT